MREYTGENQPMIDKGSWNRNSETILVKIFRFSMCIYGSKQNLVFLFSLTRHPDRPEKHSACVRKVQFEAFTPSKNTVCIS
jgi:hypothetical protein